MDTTVSLGYHHKEIHELQPLRVIHVLSNLCTSTADGGTELSCSHLLLMVEETTNDILTLLDSYLSEVLTKELADDLHL